MQSDQTDQTDLSESTQATVNQRTPYRMQSKKGCQMKLPLNTEWPVLRHYDQQHLKCIALPLGGIGTGTISLGGRGDLRDWEIVNRPAKGFAPPLAFFALYAKPAGGAAVTRALEGAIDPPYEGASGCTVANHGLPRFRSCSFAAAYPLGQVLLSDRDVPLDVRIEGLNPFVPADADASGYPAAVLRFVLTNRTSKAVSASVCGNLQNFIGTDGTGAPPPAKIDGGRRSNTFRKGNKVSGIFMESSEIAADAEQFGTFALTTTARAGISYSTARTGLGWGCTLLDLWDDFSGDGKLDDTTTGDNTAPVGSLAVSVNVPPNQSRTVTFLLAWRFPNRLAWAGSQKDGGIVGNYYATRFADAWDAAEQTAAGLKKLETDTVSFVRSFCESDLPNAVKEAALFNLSTLRTQTCFRTADGRFYGWEGCSDKAGCCMGSCTHVWNYEQATAFLFGELSRKMREVEFAHATRDDGLMSFRVLLPLERATESRKAAADGQMGCIMKVYRDWQLSGDDEMLATLWPKVRKALEFCWIPNGWDADADGVMEGCQHNTMDVEYYGPNPQMQVWYLGALRAAEAMAAYINDTDFAAKCRELYEWGSAFTDERLFNGEYYEHEIRPPSGEIAEGLLIGMGARDPKNPDFQLGAGCLVDQLVGQFLAHVCGLGYLLKPANIRKALRSILKYNFRKEFYGHFNNMRSYVLNDESALLMASYPRGQRPKHPFPYFNEVMTGFEYTAATGMLYERMTADGLRCIEAVRGRYDGLRRNPFDEAECGHHYARAMASWAAVLALTGFRYSAVTGEMIFAASQTPATWFWSTGSSWGTIQQKPSKKQTDATINVMHGTLKIKRLTLTDPKGGGSSVDKPRPVVIQKGKSVKFNVMK